MTDRVKPICPVCKKEGEAVFYIGYYDDFAYWQFSCKCVADPEDTERTRDNTLRGAYA